MLRGGLPGARWIDPENYHLTLRFIGDVDDAWRARSLRCSAGCGAAAFELRLDGLSSFGGRKPRAVVATVAPSPALMELQAEHERLMQRIGLEPEGRKFTPHVTLARLRDTSSQDVAEYLSARGGVPLRAVRGVALRAVLLARLGGRRALRGRGGLSARAQSGMAGAGFASGGTLTPSGAGGVDLKLEHRHAVRARRALSWMRN